MIPRTVLTWQGQTWQEQMTDLIRDPQELCHILELDFDRFRDRHLQAAAQKSFPLRVPRAFAARMRKGDPQDPLLLQVLPQGREVLEQAGFSADPVAEKDAGPAPGIIQKYRGRVLLLVSSACAIHCRYCFRRHFPYQDHRQSRGEWDAALEAIAADSSIREVIFSGGDPLSAPDRQLQWFASRIADIPHVDTLRIHTRLPVVIPERVDKACLEWLDQDRLNVVMVLHSNHAREIDGTVAEAIGKMRHLGITLLNQAVLLRGINDSVEDLADLSEKLFSHGVLPYYLHLLDKVEGAEHFDMPESRAIALHQALRDRLPGYLVPRLAREVPGAGAKVVVS
ncbi:EF-P beta-lysylation protein EpmB [Gilvimarinus sp. F26214L]|uniref:EF-P beta-lysylation protein EpmB n=1 Tax=Gilvimarinus sp. DZF01 TaxID=3461371 RepID=UPI004046648B